MFAVQSQFSYVESRQHHFNRSRDVYYDSQYAQEIFLQSGGIGERRIRTMFWYQTYLSTPLSEKTPEQLNRAHFSGREKTSDGRSKGV